MDATKISKITVASNKKWNNHTSVPIGQHLILLVHHIPQMLASNGSSNACMLYHLWACNISCHKVYITIIQQR